MVRARIEAVLEFLLVGGFGLMVYGLYAYDWRAAAIAAGAVIFSASLRSLSK